jgi:hypothetical protein
VVVTAALTLSILIGVARLTLAVHWLTDVLGGWALGVLWFIVVVVVGDVAASLRHRDAATGAPAPPVPEKAR